MPTTQVSASSVGTYPISIDESLMFYGAGVGILVTVPSTVTVNYTVLVSGDPQTVSPVNYNPHDTLGTTQTASANGNVVYPGCWVALKITSISGGSIVMSVVQVARSRDF